MTTMKTTNLIFLIFLLTTFSCNNNENGQNETNSEINDIDPENINIQKDEQEDNAEKEKMVMLSSDEEVVFSFKTTKGKTMNIVLQNEEKYLAYRFGTEKEVELQFPEELQNTFEQFTYSYYMRGGGAMNVGIDLNYISFKGETHQFIIYEEHSSGDPDNPKESLDVGIRIVNLKNNKESKVEGISSTVKGSLIDFRFSNLIKVEQGEM